MAKGQKRHSREAKKPKQPKTAKVIATTSPFVAALAQSAPVPGRKS
jgi:hypothetical protein